MPQLGSETSDTRENEHIYANLSGAARQCSQVSAQPRRSERQCSACKLGPSLGLVQLVIVRGVHPRISPASSSGFSISRPTLLEHPSLVGRARNNLLLQQHPIFSNETRVFYASISPAAVPEGRKA
ncbi:hypothetical protein SCP_1800070 [Sparassis crispa]|uniref:Uncharacterized protein n=1 Tax=Sparassis crispa TaxID=139825 RepID=A0A401H6B4_9APHY|nr:hypothetical protein SCP_1800070 [Sparassis crispa]GBE89985.1 hypothetical protein SCP_1800070 [Sparassis crispa]